MKNRSSQLDSGRGELELLHDGRLTPEQADALRRRIDEEPSLRRAHEQMREIDSLAMQALLTPRETSRAGEPARRVRRGVLTGLWVGAGLAACVAGGLLLAPIFRANGASAHDAPRGAAGDIAKNARSDGDHGPTTSEAVGTVAFAPRDDGYASVRTVFSIRLAQVAQTATADASSETDSAAASGASGASEAGHATSVAEASGVASDAAASRAGSAVSGSTVSGLAMARLDDALARGDANAAAEVIASADAASKDGLYRRLGSAMRSARTAADLLDKLPGEVAVDVCAAWLGQGTMQPLAMRHLSDRGRSAALRDRVHQTVHDLLVRDPSLRPWMVSYVNWAVQTEPRTSDESLDGARRIDGGGAWVALSPATRGDARA